MIDVSIAALKEGLSQIYITTHGLGVGWTHIRINSVPKYFIPITGAYPTIIKKQL